MMGQCTRFVILFAVALMVVQASRPFRVPSGMSATVQEELGPSAVYTREDNPITNDCRFALRLLTALDSGGNLFVSPFSIQVALAALTEGAQGTTASELLYVLNRSASSLPAQRSRTLQTLLQMGGSLNGSDRYILSVANALYVQRDYDLLSSFLTTVRDSYLMDVKPTDFTRPGAEVAINQWVDQATNHHIPTLIPPGALGPLTRLVLLNAVYFKGDWEQTFSGQLTRVRPFQVGKNKWVRVPTMMSKAEYPYRNFDRLGFEMLELRYSGGDVSMFVVLPNERQSVQTVTRRLLHRPFLLSDPGRKLHPTSITVFLPKFRLEESVDLKRTLETLGIKRAFRPGVADLSGVDGTQDLYVSDAFHKAAVEVNEQGARAAAATGLVITGRSMSRDPEFRVDRPFLFFIRHNPTASLLFLGRVTQLKDVAPTGAITGTPLRALPPLVRRSPFL